MSAFLGWIGHTSICISTKSVSLFQKAANLNANVNEVEMFLQ